MNEALIFHQIEVDEHKNSQMVVQTVVLLEVKNQQTQFQL